MQARIGGVAMLVVGGLMMLGGCEKKAETTTRVDRQFTVTGRSEDVARFLAMEKGRHPDFQLAAMPVAKGERVTVTTSLPTAVSGKTLVDVSRDAGLAGLDYGYSERRSVTTSPSGNVSVGRHTGG
ncbi:hypothetical protein ASE75_13535 [Sphingomonas sp. Leaf17]|uniref:hypothetical protein n=1 Tax=Sphingomonas sp. Leaf17 TaxID=1735683 RepID=UPI0006F37779|nr:hypothetical protein [Sphingomonas sp. Leaf17]KQM63453.1 hypothetical protein ASE75_13535 [Sphingomonas sp. Leaf17]